MLSIVGVGHYLPPSFNVKDLITAAGGNPQDHSGWPVVCVAQDEDHPSSMGLAALCAALSDARLQPEDIDIVLFCGVSRDYPPSWSVAVEIMRNLNMPKDRFGFDTSCGCAGALLGLQIIDGWTSLREQGRVALVTAERWSYTVDRRDSSQKTLWGHADGAAAVILQKGRVSDAHAILLGTRFHTRSEMNDAILVQYGGTRFPHAPQGTSSYFRKKRWSGTQDEYRAIQRDNYETIIGKMNKDFGILPKWVVCNQNGPGFVASIAGIAQIPSERVVLTGDKTGHVGSADVILGLEMLIRSSSRGICFMAAGTPFMAAGAVIELGGRRS